MKNRVPAVLNKLVPDKELQKRGRGTGDIAVRPDNKIALVKWFDNIPIVMLAVVHRR